MANSFPSVGAAAFNIDDVFENAAIPKIYSNSFSFGHNLTDITIVFQLMKTPMAAVIIDFTAAKTLYKSLGSVIQSVEKGLGHELKDLYETMIDWQTNINPSQPAPEMAPTNDQQNQIANEQQ